MVTKASAASKAKKKTQSKAKASSSPRRKVAQPRPGKGDFLACDVCGRAVVIDEVGDVAAVAESALLCCGEPMGPKPKKTKARKPAAGKKR